MSTNRKPNPNLNPNPNPNRNSNPNLILSLLACNPKPTTAAARSVGVASRAESTATRVDSSTRLLCSTFSRPSHKMCECQVERRVKCAPSTTARYPVVSTKPLFMYRIRFTTLHRREKGSTKSNAMRKADQVQKSCSDICAGWWGWKRERRRGKASFDLELNLSVLLLQLGGVSQLADLPRVEFRSCSRSPSLALSCFVSLSLSLSPSLSFSCCLSQDICTFCCLAWLQS